MNRTVLLAAAAILAGAPFPAGAADVAEKVRERLSWAGPGTPGCAVAVERDGTRLATVVAGSADLEHGVSITAETVFETGSVAKQFVAAAVVLLVQEGALSLDEDVRRRIPELPDYGRPITVRMLLDHTSGLRDWGSLFELAGWPRTTRVYAQSDALDVISRQKALNSEPGAAWSYTNSGYNLAAILVERVAGEPLAAFTRRRLFEPLGMNATRWRDDFRAVVPGRAVAYGQGAAGGWRQLMPFEDAHGNGGLLTTVNDLLLWNRALEADRFGLGTALARPTTLNHGSKVDYGLGVFLESAPGRREVSHAGATAGYRAFAGRHWFAERQWDEGRNGAPVSTAVLCNAGTADASAIARAAVDAVLPVYESTSQEGAPDARAESRAGLYAATTTGAPLRLVWEDGRLLVDGRPLRRVGYEWRLGADTLVFTDDGGFQRRPPGGGATTYRRVEAAAPAADPAVTGLWTSPELAATWRVEASAGGAIRISVERRPGSERVLPPVYRDAWRDGDLTVRAIRDKRGRISALSIGNSRVWDLRLERPAG